MIHSSVKCTLLFAETGLHVYTRSSSHLIYAVSNNPNLLASINHEDWGAASIYPSYSITYLNYLKMCKPNSEMATQSPGEKQLNKVFLV